MGNICKWKIHGEMPTRAQWATCEVLYKTGIVYTTKLFNIYSTISLYCTNIYICIFTMHV